MELTYFIFSIIFLKIISILFTAMKYWLSHLPCEVWVDVYRYPWISREELGQIVHRFGNRKYVEYLQFYLHDWGKRRLNHLAFYQFGLYKRVGHDPRLDFPLTPLPDNIKSVECISIFHFDARTIQFLNQIGRLLTKLRMHIFWIPPDKLTILRVILAHLVPAVPMLMNGIDLLDCDVAALPAVKLCFGDKHLVKINKLAICQLEDDALDGAARQTTVEFVMDWLNLTVQNGRPKLCATVIHNGKAFGQQISAAISQEFLMADTARTFAVFLNCAWDLAEFHLENRIGEELHCVHIAYGQVQITRHQANGGTQLQGWIEANTAKNGDQIGFDNTIRDLVRIINPTIGAIDAMDAPEIAEDEKPSTSKKASISS